MITQLNGIGTFKLVLIAIREIPRKSTGLSPFKILYGANLRDIMDIYKALLLDNNLTQETKDAYTYIMELRERIIYSCMYAKESLEKSDEKRIFYANRNTKLRTLKAGDKLLIILPGRDKIMVSLGKDLIKC